MLTHRSAKLHLKLSFLNSIGKAAGIKGELLEQLIDSLEVAHEASKIDSASSAEFLNDVPIHLRVKLTENIYSGVANKIHFLKNAGPELISYLIPKLVSLKVKKNEYVYKKGQFSSALYLLFSGRVGEVDRDVCFREYGPASYFGEVEILSNVPRKFAARALEDTHLLLLTRADLEHSLQVFSDFKIQLLTSSIIKEMRTKHTLEKVVPCNPVETYEEHVT